MKDNIVKVYSNIIKSNEIDEYITIKYESCRNSKREGRIIVYIKNNPLITIPSTLFPSFEHFFQNSKMPLNLKEKPQGKSLSNVLYQKLLQNLIIWSENNYDTKFIDYKIAFPLLKELRKVGDTKFQIIFQQEILKEYATSGAQVKEFLKNNGYLKLIGDFF
jgi:hypothetical protein